MSSYRFSLTEAIFVNINIMIGSGIFINILPLTQKLGIFSFAAYLFIGVLLLPLILSMIALLSYHPTGGFYTYGKEELSPAVGFITSWSYVIGKMASATLLMLVCARFLHELIPALKTITVSFVFYALLFCVVILNSVGSRFGSLIQKIIVYAKFIPIVLGIIIGIYRLFFLTLPDFSYNFLDIVTAIPLVQHATSGFEMACILSVAMHDPEINAPKAVFFSYAIVILVSAVYQFFSSVVLIDLLPGLSQYYQAFHAIAGTFFIPEYRGIIQLALYFGIMISAFGSAFGMFFGTMWNLYTLAKQRHLFASDLFIRKNRFGIPLFILFFEAGLGILFFLISQNNVILLQQCVAIALSLTFTLSIFALLARRIRDKSSIVLPVFGLCNCSIFIATSAYSLAITSMHAFVLFSCILFFGLAMLLITGRKIEEIK
jgi:amino acid transporter